MSDDGLVVVGRTLPNFPANEYVAVRWTEQTGMVPLGYLPGGRESSWAYAASADGSLVVGVSDSLNSPSARPQTGEEAFLWTLTNGQTGEGVFTA